MEICHGYFIVTCLGYAGSTVQGGPLTVTIAATATIQGATDGGDPNETAKPPPTLKITTQWLIQQIAAQNNATAPKGALLKWDGGLGFIVTDAKGTDTGWDASSLTMVNSDADDSDSPAAGISIWQGQRNSATGKYTTTYQRITTISYDDGNDTTFYITGVPKGTYNASAMDKDGNYSLSDSRSITSGIGGGTIQGVDAIISSATISAAFKGKITTQ